MSRVLCCAVLRRYDDVVAFLDPITKYNNVQGYMFNIRMLKTGTTAVVLRLHWSGMQHQGTWPCHPHDSSSTGVWGDIQPRFAPIAILRACVVCAMQCMCCLVEECHLQRA